MSATPPWIRHRIVGFGTSFVSVPGLRTREGTEQDPEQSPSQLFSNEIAVDVGGTCRDHDGTQMAVYDHHFKRDGFPAGFLNYGSAGLALLANASAIAEQMRDLAARDADTVWVVTHQDPDFDACFSSYLVTRLVRQPELVETFRELAAVGTGRARDPFIDWKRYRRPATLGDSETHLTALLLYQLAIYAARVDQCEPDSSPREASLRFLFQAAQARERFAANPADAGAFFDEVLGVLRRQHLNPLVDAFRPGGDILAAEIEFVHNQEAVYRDDMDRRARMISVPIAKSRGPFSDWIGKYRTSLWKEDGRPTKAFENLLNVNADALGGCLADREMLDGVEIVAPRCHFFKDWVRQDTARSPRGAGFQYTAIAYPGHGEKPSEYYFSLDPEYAAPRHLHLYDLWATLQIAEGPERVEAPDQNPRTDVVARARDGASGLRDPWFDGNNYAATIVVSPRRGASPDLSGGRFGPTPEEDPILRLAARWIGRSFYQSSEVEGVLFKWHSGEPEVKEIGLSGDIERGEWNEWDSTSGPGTGSLIFAEVRLRENLRTDSPEFETASIQIGQSLWRLISPVRTGFPSDFRERHVVRGDDWILVWNRRGVAVASKRPMTQLGNDVRTVARILERVDRNLHGAANAGRSGAEIDDSIVKKRLQDSQWTLEQVTALERKCRSDEGRAIRPFLEAVGLSTVARDVDALNNLYRDTLETRRDNILTDVLAIGSFLALAISWIQTLEIKPKDWSLKLGHFAWAILILMGTVYTLIRIKGTRWFSREKDDDHG